MVTRSNKESIASKQKGTGVKVGKLSLRKERIKNLSASEKKQVKGGRGTGGGTGDYSCLQVWSCLTKP